MSHVSLSTRIKKNYLIYFLRYYDTIHLIERKSIIMTFTIYDFVSNTPRSVSTVTANNETII